MQKKKKKLFYSFRMNRRERDDERRQWADMVASATANFNILSARNGQELVNARIDVEDVLAGLKGYEDISREKRDALHGLLEASVTKMQCVIKSLYVHIQYGAGVALELRQASTSYLSEDESRLAKKMKKEFEGNVMRAREEVRREIEVGVCCVVFSIIICVYF